jgi:thioredoxin reductase
VEVDGVANQRACMVKVERPMTVRREAHLRPLPAKPAGLPPRRVGEVRLETPDVLVVGGGPGGLSAAIAARRAGAGVVLLDERSSAGGQYYKQLGVAALPGPDHQHRAGAALIREAIVLGVDIRTDALVWGAFEPREFIASIASRPVRFEPKVAIVATGAYERPWPVPGWTLPGVMTTGAAQTFWRTARRLPGRRILIVGNGPLNLQLAAELADGGADVVAVVEASAKPGIAQAKDLTTMLRASPGLVADGLRYAWTRHRSGAEMIHGKVLAAVEPAATGLMARLAPTAGGPMEPPIAVDVVCIGYGFEPSNELLRVLGCRHDWDAGRRQLVTQRDDESRTSLAGVFALGDCTGLGGAKVALAEGTIAGLAAARDLGVTEAPTLSALGVKARSDRRRHRAFQAALWRIYAAPAFSPTLARPETIICRCEEVTFGAVEAALDEGLAGIGSVKRRTRLGMGRCQGRYCAPVLDALMAARNGTDRHEFSGFAPRVPVKPVAIADLARGD